MFVLLPGLFEGLPPTVSASQQADHQLAARFAWLLFLKQKWVYILREAPDFPSTDDIAMALDISVFYYGGYDLSS
jgi:hypothetical protein